MKTVASGSTNRLSQTFARWARGATEADGSMELLRSRSQNSVWMAGLAGLAWDLMWLAVRIPRILVEVLRNGDEERACQWLRDHPGAREAWEAEARAEYAAAPLRPDYPPPLYHVCGPPGCAVWRRRTMSAEALARESEYEQRQRSIPPEVS